MDARRRELERRAAAGDADALAQVYVTRVREGEGQELIDALFRRLLADELLPQELEALVILRDELPEVRQRLLDQELKHARTLHDEGDRLLDAVLTAAPAVLADASFRPARLKGFLAILDADANTQRAVVHAGFRCLKHQSRPGRSAPLTWPQRVALGVLLDRLLARTRRCPLDADDLTHLLEMGREPFSPDSGLWTRVLGRIERLAADGELPDALRAALEGTTTTCGGVFAAKVRRKRVQKLLGQRS